MLPSNGYFKHIFCPYDKAKLCHRPYCHYKHAETDLGEKAAGEVEETEYLFDAKPTTNMHHPIRSTYTLDYAPTSPDYDINSGYVPTPVVKPVGILKTNNRNNQMISVNHNYSMADTQCFEIPEYNPTPISRLKELNTSQPYVDIIPPNIRKKKKGATEEYDPTTVKCVSKKSVKCVMFADQAGIALDDAGVPDFSSSDEEMDDSASAPKFSDDDLDEDGQILNRPRVTEVLKPQKKKIVEEEEEEEEDVEEKDIDEFSLVDKILVNSKKNEKLLKSFKKTSSSSKPKQLPPKKISKKPVETKKNKGEVEKNGIYDFESKVPASISEEIPSDFDAVVSIASFDELKGDETKNKDKSIHPVKKSASVKNSGVSKTKHSSDLSSKEERSKVHSKSKNSSSDKNSKEMPHISKHSVKSTDTKTNSHKYSKSTERSKSNDSEKRKSTVSVSSKTEKSSSNNKLSKSEKNKSSTHSNTHKTNSNNKLSKSEKNLSNVSKSSAKEKEAKLQDEKVSSSSIAKKNKHDQNIKHLSKSLDSHSEGNTFSKIKSKNSSKEDISKTKMSKRKAEYSDSESSSVKRICKDKSYSTASKKAINDTDDDDISSTDGAVDDIIDVSSESEDDTEEQCKRIFEETFVPNDENISSDKEDSSSGTKPTFRDLNILRKQRLAHAGATSSKKSVPSAQKSNIHPTRNAGQVMLDRYARIRAAQAELTEGKERNSVLNSPGRSTGKTRISVAPNHSLLAALAEKNRMSQSTNTFSPLPSTVTKTLKVTKRVAHIPDIAVKPRPIIPVDYGSKVPTVVRQKFLNAFIDEYLKLSLTEDEAYESALEEEKNAYQRSSSKAIYMNVSSNALNRLRHRVGSNPDVARKKGEVVSSTTHPSKTVSHETLLNGPQAQRTSFSIERKKSTTTPDLKGTALYEHLSTYVLSEDQLKENGYPFPHASEVGRAVIEGIYANRTHYCNDPFKRTCSRCQKIYYVNVDGDYVRDEECDFHWGRLFKRRIAGALESRYTCCQGDSESDGCCVGTGHVFEGSEAHALKGYVNTLPKTPPPDHYYGIYALDCEMCYTTAGIELTRISVIGPDLKPVYETFVKPQHKVLDYNTRFSGITEENLKNVRTTIRDVQAVLLCMFNSRTILIGHSLESDFKALKLFHRTVVDTSVVFPHKLGLPFKRALRNLSSEKLNKIIQNDVGGHDSAEDAVACMELMIYKIKEDLKGNR